MPKPIIKFVSNQTLETPANQQVAIKLKVTPAATGDVTVTLTIPAGPNGNSSWFVVTGAKNQIVTSVEKLKDPWKFNFFSIAVTTNADHVPQTTTMEAKVTNSKGETSNTVSIPINI